MISDIKETVLCNNLAVPEAVKRKLNCTQRENFEGNNSYSYAGGIIYTMVWIFAIYLSIRCNKDGLNPFELIGACCCPWCYIIWKLITDISLCGVLPNPK